MRKSSLMNSVLAGLALAAGIQELGISATRTAGAVARFGGRVKLPTLKRNRTDSASNRGIVAQRKANKVARHARVFNAQRARA